MNDQILHFTQLIAWRKNNELVVDAYKLTKKFPKDELFGLTSQIRRSAISITANIAEGFGRYHFKDKRRFYLQARGSNTELQNHLIVARDLKYITNLEFKDFITKALVGYKIICGLINSVDK